MTVLETTPSRADQALDRTSLWVAGTLLAIGAVFAFTWSLNDRSALVQAGQYAIIAYCSVRAAACTNRDRPRLATLVTWLFTYTLFGLVQTVQLSYARNPFRVPAPDSDMLTQIAVILVGLVAFDVVSTRQATKPQIDVASDARQLSLPRTITLSLVVLATTPLLLHVLGGAGSLFASRQAVTDTLLGTGTDIPPTRITILAFANVAPFVCAFSLVRLHVAGVFRFKKRFELQVLTGLLVGVNVVFNNPISQPRYWVATVVIAIAVSGTWVLRPRFLYAFAAGFVVVTLLVFPYLDVFRYANVGSASLTAQPSVVETYLAKTDYGSAQDITNAITYVRDDGHTGGRQLLGAATFFVPRSYWPNKPTDTNQILARHIGFSNLNIDSPLWAEGYIDFGFLGVAGVMGVFGFITGRGDRMFNPAKHGAAMVSLLVPLLVGYELILLRGSLLQAMGRLTMVLLLVWVVSNPPQRNRRIRRENF